MRSFLLLVTLIGISQAQSTSFDSLELFATLLPAHFSIFEAINGLELRLYVAKSSATAVSVTPTSAGVSFEPSYALFSSTASVASGITAQVNMTGDLTIDYVATMEDSSAMNTVLFSQSATVISPPRAYAVDAKDWSGVTLQNDSFEDTAATTLTSSFWSKQQHRYRSNACGAFTGNNSLLFTSLGDRLALTALFELEGFHGKMHFYHLYGFEAVQSYDAEGDNRTGFVKLNCTLLPIPTPSDSSDRHLEHCNGYTRAWTGMART